MAGSQHGYVPGRREGRIHVDPFDIQIMNKPASEDEEAVGVNE